MIEDIWTVMWKEWHEYAAGGGSGRGRGLIGVLIIIGIVSILLPFQLVRQGNSWVDSPLPVLIDGVYLPFTILLNVIADSFAGERERHTLETLLASRLSERAILFGKVGAATAYGLVLALIAAALQLVVANLAGGFGFYPAGTIIAIVVLGLLFSLLAASAGCLISLRAPTTRQAQQILGIGFMVLIFVPIILIQLLPASAQAQILTWLNTTAPGTIFALLVAGLVLLDAILLAIARLRFQRAQLIGS
ncbi:MAG TPA: ABC transporter permease [Ktedonobacterales bacterium]|nr:ABC transporter permease [Ktedonobacterales bacterium]